MRCVENELFDYDVEYCAIIRKAPSTSRIVDYFLRCLLDAHCSKPHKNKIE